MKVKQLQLHNFRNYEHLDMTFGPGVNVLSGFNGQGKTNLLEALYCCSCARSHRTARDTELIRRGAEGYRIELLYDTDRYKDETLTLAYFNSFPDGNQEKKSRRLLWHDGLLQARIASLYGLFNAVIFAPEDLMLVKEGPAERRRFLDILISQIKPGYFSDLQQYTKVLNQRNTLLKQLRDKSAYGLDQLDLLLKTEWETWTERLAELALNLIRQRLVFAEQISQLAGQFHRQIANDHEQLSLRYQSQAAAAAQAAETKEPAGQLRQLQQLYRRNYDNDVARGATGSGPHRDDLILSINGQPLKAFGSQGQQRTAVLALKLAELKLLKQYTGEMPVLLLDDVMSELDVLRRGCLVEAIKGCQVFISCTDTEAIRTELKELGRTQTIDFYQVQEAKVSHLDEAAPLPD